MPAYQATPFGIRKVLLPGIVGYSFGGFNINIPTTKMRVTSVAIATNVATLGVTLDAGVLPAVGSLISVQGTQTTTSGGAPNFNVSNASITAVSGFNTGNNDTGTVSFALVSSNISTTVDAGSALVPQPETADAMATGSGQQFGMLVSQGLANNSRDISWAISTPSAPGSFTANLQVADVDQDANYTTVDTTTAAGNRTITGIRANFVRGNISAVSGGTNPTVIFRVVV